MYQTRNITVTVFMAVFNGEKYIGEAIQSVLGQSYTDFEIIVINDGSTDATLDIIEMFDDTRIRLLHNDGNKGLTFTRNRGAMEARGKYFATLDSDDLAMPDRLRTQVQYMEANPNVAICGGQALWIDAYGNALKPYKVSVGENLSHLLVFHNVFINSTLMMKTETIRELGGYRELAPAEDYDLSFRIGLTHQVTNLKHIFVKYRVHENNISTVQSEKLKNAERSIIENIHSSMSVPLDAALINAHQNILHHDFKSTDVNEFKELLIALWTSNALNAIYPKLAFDKLIFDIWFRILREKDETNIIALYFQSPFFKWSFVTFKQLSKIFRKACFGT